MSDWVQRYNHFKYRFKYRYGQHLPLTAPVDVSLELSSACNQACVYCYHADKANLPFAQKLMNLDTASKILTQAAELEVNSLKFNYRGEPTMNPNFTIISKLARAYAWRSTFIDRVVNSNFKFTKGADYIFEGLSAMTKVKVSVDSFRKDIFEAQRAGGIFELAMSNLDRFYNHRLRKDTELVIQAVRTQANKDEDLEGEIKRRFPGATASIRNVVEGRVEKDLSETLVVEREPERQSCLQAHVRLIFLHDGRAIPCCPDIKEKLVLGSIHIHTISEMFNSIEVKKLRQDLKCGGAFDKEPCKSCPSFESYRGFKPKWNS